MYLPTTSFLCSVSASVILSFGFSSVVLDRQDVSTEAPHLVMSTGIVTKTKREKDRDPEIEDVIEEDLGMASRQWL